MPPARLHAMGYKLAAYPLTLLSAAVRAMDEALTRLRAGDHPADLLLDFEVLRRHVGFEEYYEEETRYNPRISA